MAKSMHVQAHMRARVLAVKKELKIQHGVTGVVASTRKFFPGPPQLHTLIGAAASWQQSQRRGVLEYLG
eukprot:126092-Pelagomonas_calceolata.AAC.5